MDNECFKSHFVKSVYFPANPGMIEAPVEGDENVEVVTVTSGINMDNLSSVNRLWISSLTEEAIREGFANLKEQSEFQPLYEAGLSRAIGDWVLGMNATRLYTRKYGQNRQVLSI